jgi:predicted AlkP superfamily phosphohydrolase/phosphomutase
MKTPVIAIGLDAADPDLVDEWIADGHLPNLARLRNAGVYGRLRNLEYYKAETPWTTFLTGCKPATTGYWTPVKFLPDGYTVKEIEAYDFADLPPFYALGEAFRIAAFDIPQSALSENANGPQVLAWGAHSPQTPSHSLPPELLDQVTESFGAHPALHKDHGEWWDPRYLTTLHQALKTGIARRTDICRDWIRQEPWNLFLTIFSETHSAGHDLWHVSRTDNPLYGSMTDVFDFDPLLDIYKDVDRSVGEILALAPEPSYKVVFSVHGSDNNITDVTSMVLLPEFLYRYSFPGKAMMAPGRAGAPVPPVIKPMRIQDWHHEIREYAYDPNPIRRVLKYLTPDYAHRRINRLIGGPLAPDLYSIAELQAMGKELTWQPTNWYSKVWPNMKAFALPTFSEGYIRINLRGREPAGIVEPENYDALCGDLTAELHKLVNPRTGLSVVKKVIRTRQSATDSDPHLPDADLVVVWAEEPADVVDHPTAGRIGPVPYRRAGSHRARGFWAAQGPGLEAGASVAEADAVDLTATIVALMGAPVACHLDGRPIPIAGLTAPNEVTQPDTASGGG